MCVHVCCVTLLHPLLWGTSPSPENLNSIAPEWYTDSLVFHWVFVAICKIAKGCAVYSSVLLFMSTITSHFTTSTR